MLSPVQEKRKFLGHFSVLVPIIPEVFTKINFDACDPLPTATSVNRYLIAAICLASKYPHALQFPNIGSVSIIEELLEASWVSGKEIETDQGNLIPYLVPISSKKRTGFLVICRLDKVFKSNGIVKLEQ
ncbi:retrovirus-related Pol polyprotein from transposon 412 [Trichonephila clavipes]|uniref:Retrovirus-related Pol polyprotein from transposon 412 n=1 Tax=Trichonephila clavipes TaxID=2585209 RepID=A0A8X6R6M9_TRICX|nr:retrovirus-related Pol polyprotein from transposon 412 [Trichonephila clavipes]